MKQQAATLCKDIEVTASKWKGFFQDDIQTHGVHNLLLSLIEILKCCAGGPVKPSVVRQSRQKKKHVPTVQSMKGSVTSELECRI